MSKKVLITGRKDDRVEFDTPQSFAARLSEFSPSGDIEYVYCNLEDILFSYDGETLAITTDKAVDIKTFNGIFFIGWFKTKLLEDLALSVSLYATHHGVKCWNSEANQTRSRTKLSQYVAAALHGVSITAFVSSMNDQRVTEALQSAIIGFPCIAKSVTASRGKDNYLVNNMSELVSSLQSSPDKLFVVQAFVPNDGDYRIIVLGSEVAMVIHRQGDGDTHLNNTSTGGTATIVEANELNQDMLRDSVKMATAIRREITGVDMIIHKETGQYYMLEINNMPQLSTGSFVIEKSQKLHQFFEDQLSG